MMSLDCQAFIIRPSLANWLDTVNKIARKSKDGFDEAHSTGVKAQPVLLSVTSRRPCAWNRICKIAVISNKPSTRVTSLSRTISYAFIYYVQTGSSLEIKCSKTL